MEDLSIFGKSPNIWEISQNLKKDMKTPFVYVLYLLDENDPGIKRLKHQYVSEPPIEKNSVGESEPEPLTLGSYF